MIKSGVYKIENKVNNKVYIGSSKNIEKRWCQHKKSLIRDKHHSIKLQRAWNKYGEDNFEFSVIEECDEDKLFYLEQFYIDKYKSYFEGYNCKEKAMDVLTEERYLEHKYLHDTINDLETIMSIGKNSFDIYFFNTDTLKNIKNKKQTIKYRKDEYVYYWEICAFVSLNFGMYGYKTIAIHNNEKPNFVGFSFFPEDDYKLDFTVHMSYENIVVSCSLYIDDLTIVINKVSECENFDFLFAKDKDICDDYIDNIRRYLFRHGVKLEKLTENYFNKLLGKNAFNKHMGVGHPMNYKKIYKNCEGFLEKFIVFMIDNKLTYYVRTNKEYFEFKVIDCDNKEYENILLNILNDENYIYKK